MTKAFASFKSFLRDEQGATAIEYGLIAGLMAVIIIGGIGLMGGQLENIFTNIANTLGGANTGGSN